MTHFKIKHKYYQLNVPKVLEIKVLIAEWNFSQHVIIMVILLSCFVFYYSVVVCQCGVDQRRLVVQ